MMNITLIILLITVSITTKMASASSTSRNLFASDIFQKLITGKAENVILSPASIQICLAMTYFGTAGRTADELVSVLKLDRTTAGQRDDIAKDFKDFIDSSFHSSNDNNAVQLRIANRIYVNDKYKLKPKFNEVVSKVFQSEAEIVNFADSTNAINKINGFVEERTQNKIKNALQSGSVNGDTSVVLINAIYFKGKWKVPFSASSTQKGNFANEGGQNQVVSVDTMHMTEWIQYGEFPDLDAKVIELPYANSNLSMMILLPNRNNGLQNLEEKLRKKDLNEISSQLQKYEVQVSLPKFRIEYEIDLGAPLKSLGLNTLFTNEADLSNLLESGPRQRVDEVKHKAFIDVNEAGSEAAAVTFVKLVPMSLNMDEKVFKADHPFAFAIRDSKAVYFSGHVVKFQ